MRYLLDTNVFLDVALGRTAYKENSKTVLDWCERHTNTGFIAWHSLSNIFYILKRHKSATEAKKFIKDLSMFIEVAPIMSVSLPLAMNEPMTDFEDAMQVAAAKACLASHIITRNLKDFKRASIKTMSPAQFKARVINSKHRN